MAKRNIGKEIIRGLEEIKSWKKGKSKLKIDTEVRHLTKPGTNLFEELGLAPGEAKRLHVAARKQIDDTRLQKQKSPLGKSKRSPKSA